VKGGGRSGGGRERERSPPPRGFIFVTKTCMLCGRAEEERELDGGMCGGATASSKMSRFVVG